MRARGNASCNFHDLFLCMLHSGAACKGSAGLRRPEHSAQFPASGLQMDVWCWRAGERGVSYCSASFHNSNDGANTKFSISLATHTATIITRSVCVPTTPDAGWIAFNFERVK